MARYNTVLAGGEKIKCEDAALEDLLNNDYSCNSKSSPADQLKIVRLEECVRSLAEVPYLLHSFIVKVLFHKINRLGQLLQLVNLYIIIYIYILLIYLFRSVIKSPMSLISIDSKRKSTLLK